MNKFQQALNTGNSVYGQPAKPAPVVPTTVPSTAVPQMPVAPTMPMMTAPAAASSTKTTPVAPSLSSTLDKDARGKLLVRLRADQTDPSKGSDEEVLSRYEKQVPSDLRTRAARYHWPDLAKDMAPDDVLRGAFTVDQQDKKVPADMSFTGWLAKKSHEAETLVHGQQVLVVRRLRREHPDLADLSDDQLLTGVRKAFYPSMADNEALVEHMNATEPLSTEDKAAIVARRFPNLQKMEPDAALKLMFESGQKSKKVPETETYDGWLESIAKPTFGDRAKAVAKSVGEGAVGIVKGLASDIVALPMGAAQEAQALGETMQALPHNEAELMAPAFGTSVPGKVEHAMKGESLATEGAKNIARGGIVVGSALATGGTGSLLEGVAAPALRLAAEGIIGGATYGAGMKAVEGGSPQEIAKAGLYGAGAGMVAAPVIGGIAHGVGKAIGGKAGQAAAEVAGEAGAANEAARVPSVAPTAAERAFTFPRRAAGADRFATQFGPDDLASFGPVVLDLENNTITPREAAQRIVEPLYGAGHEEAVARVAQTIERIGEEPQGFSTLRGRAEQVGVGSVGELPATHGEADIARLHEDIPFPEGVSPESQRALSTTKPEKVSGRQRLINVVRDLGQGRGADNADIYALRRFGASLFKADPGLRKSTADRFYIARARLDAAHEAARMDLSAIKEPLRNDPKALAGISRLMIEEDNVATAKSEGSDHVIDGRPLAEAEKTLTLLDTELRNNPAARNVYLQLRGYLSNLFKVMESRGMVEPGQYRAGYVPRRMLRTMIQAYADARGEDAGKLVQQELSATKTRMKGVMGERETDTFKLIERYSAKLYQRMAQDDLMSDLLNSPLNVTEKFQPGDVVGPRYKVYRPAPGLPGYVAPEGMGGDFVDGLQHALGTKANQFQGGYVMPREVVDALEHFHTGRPGSIEKPLYKAGQAYSRWLTVYNAANTVRNFLTDYPVALLGQPGEKAQPLGIIRFTPRAVKEAYNIFSGKATAVTELATREGLTTGTLAADVGGLPTEVDNVVARFFKSSRQAVEAFPRIAAGLEALDRTGKVSEFGRIGRQSTLPYGAGAPLVTRSAGMRFLSPFWQWMGLATDRIVGLATTPGSRARTWSALLAVPTATFMWNYRNDDFKKVEESLRPYERSTAHVILPDPSNPMKPYLDKSGKPMVLRFTWSVPEQIAQTFGLGNMVSRLYRVSAGRDQMSEVLPEIGQQIGQQAVQQMVPLGAMLGLFGEFSPMTGQKQAPLLSKEGLVERGGNFVPVARQLRESIQEGRNVAAREGAGAGVTAGVGKMASKVAGVSMANTEFAQRDADRAEAVKKVRDATAELRYMLKWKRTAEAADARTKLTAAVVELAAINKAIKTEQSK